MKISRLILAIVAFNFLLSSCNDNRNSLSKIGFAVPNSNVSIDENPWNLKGEETFVKARMTLAQAASLRKAFLAQRQASNFDSTPKSFPLFPSHAAWTPRLVTKYWSGSFEQGTGKDTYYNYSYIFDIKNPKNVELYFYGLAMDD